MAIQKRKREAREKSEALKAPSLFGSLKMKKGALIKKDTSFKGHIRDDGVDADTEEGAGGGYEDDNDADFNLWEQGEDADDDEEYVEANQARDNEVEVRF